MRDTIKLLEENIGKTLFAINRREIFFFWSTSYSNENKNKINIWDLIKLKSFTQQRNHKQNETQPSELEKIFVNEAPNKGLISKIYKQLI